MNTFSQQQQQQLVAYVTRRKKFNTHYFKQLFSWNLYTIITGKNDHS